MPTTTVKTIGTGGDYTTLQAWENACPANLVTADEIWEGQVKNQEFTASSTLLTISGQTTDATRYIVLTTEAGASFADNANKLTNALRYNASNGAAIRQTTGYGGPALNVSTAYTRVSKLQFSAAQNIDTGMVVYAANCTVDQVISLGRHCGIAIAASTTTLRNSLFISTAAPRNDSAAVFISSGSVTAYNCTGVCYSTSSPAGLSGAFLNSYATMLLRNCAGFGFPYFTRITAISGSSSNNGSDRTIAVGSGNQASLTYANQFENTATGTADFRLKSGATLIDTGADLSGSGITVDIVGTTRSVPYDIGAWEFANPNVSVTLTGITATISAGTVSAAIGVEIAGIAATTAAGTPTSAIDADVAGAALTVSAGALAYTIGATVSGSVVVGYAGALDASIGASVTSGALAASPGFLLAALGANVSGAAAAAFPGIVTVGGAPPDPVPAYRVYFVPEADRDYAMPRSRRIYRAPRDVRIVIVPGREKS